MKRNCEGQGAGEEGATHSGHRGTSAPRRREPDAWGTRHICGREVICAVLPPATRPLARPALPCLVSSLFMISFFWPLAGLASQAWPRPGPAARLAPAWLLGASGCRASQPRVHPSHPPHRRHRAMAPTPGDPFPPLISDVSPGSLNNFPPPHHAAGRMCRGAGEARLGVVTRRARRIARENEL